MQLSASINLRTFLGQINIKNDSYKLYARQIIKLSPLGCYVVIVENA